jgi:hypothetical protein
MRLVRIVVELRGAHKKTRNDEQATTIACMAASLADGTLSSWYKKTDSDVA